jgi:MFS family permease
MFLVTLAVYLVATVLTAFTWDVASFAFCRFLTGFGIGGEYAAINSAIDELIPARLRGRVDLAINGTFWIGAAMGAGLSILLLNPDFMQPNGAGASPSGSAASSASPSCSCDAMCPRARAGCSCTGG